MCGIFGITTSKGNAARITFDGLKDIEYRGYDSWGIADWKLEVGGWKVEKEVGFLPKNLEISSSARNDNIHLSLGHTRWATHGGVTQANAHPHTDCTGKLVLVHNGIVENFLELKKSLKSHKFRSETDTEVLVHLIEQEYDGDLQKAVIKVLKVIKGLNAVVVSDGKVIVATKVGSPLVVGISNEGQYIASDPNALLTHTKKLMFLEDHQVVVLDSSKKIAGKFTTVNWNHSSAELDNFPHFMLKEIHQQPEVINSIAKDSQEIDKVSKMVKQAFGTFLIACGTASYACLAGVYLFSKYAKKHVNFSVGSEFNYIEDYIKSKSLVIAVSQSGESIDTLEPILVAKKRKAKTVALVNVLGSTLYRTVDFPLLLQAGVEKAVASTKAMIAMLSLMILLSHTLINKKNQARQILKKSSLEIKKILKRKNLIKKLADKIYKSEHIYILGRGLSYPVALEATLKIKEISYIHSEGFAGGELKHGVIALIEKGTPVIVFAPSDETHDAILSNAMEVSARGAYVIGVGSENNPVFDYFFKVGDVGASSILPNVVFAQLLAYYLAVKLGYNPDKPRNLAKSVVVR